VNLLAQGRECDIFDLGDGTVLRRSREGRSQATEAEVLRFVAEHGYPVPEVVDVREGGQDIVLRKIEGPTMLADLGDHPWRVRSHARTLARLHQDLHQIEAPAWLPALPDGGDRLVHLDLHPLNVLVSPIGPVVIDWPRAARGTAGSDVARTWTIMAAASTGDRGPKRLLVAALRGLLVRTFLAESGAEDEAAGQLAWAIDFTIQHTHMSPDEHAAMRNLIRRAGPDGADGDAGRPRPARS
jgi:aminoglycoside phosphotransferase (APT) family kinase protein